MGHFSPSHNFYHLLTHQGPSSSAGTEARTQGSCFLVGFRLWVIFHSVYSNRRILRNVSCVNVSKVKLSFHKPCYIKTLNNILFLKLLLTYQYHQKKKIVAITFFQRKTVLKISYKSHNLYHV